VEHKLNQISSDSGIIEINMGITFFICVTTLHSTLPKNVDGFRLFISKLREENLF